MNLLSPVVNSEVDPSLLYPKKVEFLEANWGNRKGPGVLFGLQPFLMKLVRAFNTFMQKPKAAIDDDNFRYPEIICRWRSLAQLGYLPLRIDAVNEGTRCPDPIPMVRIRNTNPGFAWLVPYVGRLMARELWYPSAYLAAYMDLVGQVPEGSHPSSSLLCDLSREEYPSEEAAALAGLAALCKMYRSDNAAAIKAAGEYYFALPTTWTKTVHVEPQFSLGDSDPSVLAGLISQFSRRTEVVLTVDPDNPFEFLDYVVDRVRPQLGPSTIVLRWDTDDLYHTLLGDPTNPDARKKAGAFEYLWEKTGRMIVPSSLPEKTKYLGTSLVIMPTGFIDRATYTNISQALVARNLSGPANIRLGIRGFRTPPSRTTCGLSLRTTFAAYEDQDIKLRTYKTHGDESGDLGGSPYPVMTFDNVAPFDIREDKPRNPELGNLGGFQNVLLNGRIVKVQTLDSIARRAGGLPASRIYSGEEIRGLMISHGYSTLGNFTI